MAFALAAQGGVGAADGEAASTSLELRLQGVEDIEKATEAERGRLLLERVDQPGQEPLVLPLRSVQTVAVPVGSRWFTNFEAKGLWGPRVLLEADPSTPRIWAFNLRPAGNLSGRLTSRSLPLPKRFFATSVLAGMGNAESPCSIATGGAFECVVPAGLQDVVLSVGTFAPVRFRDQTVRPGQGLALPITELLPGASLGGQVTMVGENLKTGNGPQVITRVRVFRFVAGAKSSFEPPKPLAESAAAADGSFSFVGLEPGTMLLEVTRTGFSPFRLFPLELVAGTEVTVPNAIDLTRPFEAVVEVSPVTDVYGLPWTVTLERTATDPIAPEESRSSEGRTDAEGRFRAPNQSSGRTRLEIRDSAGNTFHSDSDVWLAPGSEALVSVDLPLVSVSGLVTLAGRPQVATLHFGGRRGKRHVQLETDLEGRFEGTLPKPGLWTVDVDADGYSTFTKVTIAPGLDDHRAEVNIELPDTHVFGRVIDEQGNPVEGAIVEVSAEGYFQDVRSDSTGAFEARAIPPRLISVAADLQMNGKEPLTSEPQLLELREEQPLGPIELRLRSLERLTARVLRGNQPVPGAVVGLASRGGSFYADRAISDHDGVARPKVDPRTREWDVVVMAPGAALAAFRQPNTGSPLELRVDEVGGELTIELPMPFGQTTADNLRLIVLREGVSIGLPWLVEWRRALGLPVGLEPEATSLTFPRLALGNYTACLEPLERAQRQLAEGGEGLLNCRSGQLQTGGLALTLSKPNG